MLYALERFQEAYANKTVSAHPTLTAFWEQGFGKDTSSCDVAEFKAKLKVTSVLNIKYYVFIMDICVTCVREHALFDVKWVHAYPKRCVQG